MPETSGVVRQFLSLGYSLLFPLYNLYVRNLAEKFGDTMNLPKKVLYYNVDHE